MLVLGLFTMLGASELAISQGNSDHHKNKGREITKQQQKADKKQAKDQERRIKADRARQAEWARQNARIQADQQRRDQYNKRNHSGNDRSNGNGYYNGNANANTNRNTRYRVYRNGSYYNTDQRGADLLRQAVNQGYRQGFEAARNDRNNRRQSSWNNSNEYRRGTYGYQSYVNQSQYQYYFRQGFQRGYQDGYNSRYQNDYYGDYQYGSNNGGAFNIFGTILSQILNIQTY